MGDQNESNKKQKLNLLLVGHVGAGKSSTANSILMPADEQNGKLFKEASGIDPMTNTNEQHTR